MGLSNSEYLGDGESRVFTVGFPYLAKEHIRVYVNDTPVLFSLIHAGAVQTVDAPPVGSSVRVQRETPAASPVVEFSNSSTLKSQNLNDADKQKLYAIQELRDYSEGELQKQAYATAAAVDVALTTQDYIESYISQVRRPPVVE